MIRSKTDTSCWMLMVAFQFGLQSNQERCMRTWSWFRHFRVDWKMCGECVSSKQNHFMHENVLLSNNISYFFWQVISVQSSVVSFAAVCIIEINLARSFHHLSSKNVLLVLQTDPSTNLLETKFGCGRNWKTIGATQINANQKCKNKIHHQKCAKR